MSITPFLHEKFAGELWRMEIDDISDTLFVEVRNSAERLVSFSAVDLENGKILFKNVSAPERWLTGMETGYDGVLLLHFYENESGPKHRGLMAIDGTTGAQLWSNFMAAFNHLSVNGPVIYDARVQPVKLVLADIRTGATIRAYQPSVDIVPHSAVVMPGNVLTEGFALLPGGVKPVENWAHYHELNNFRIVSLHASHEGLVDQLLFVFDGTGPGDYRQVFMDCLNAGIQKMQPEAFIVHRNRLIYIKNRSELIILNL